MSTFDLTVRNGMEVEFLQEKVVQVDQRQTLLEAALNAGIPHFHACGGKGKCSTCRVLVLEGREHLQAPTTLEAKLISVLKLPSTVRLACQTKIMNGPVKVERLIKVASDISAFLKPNEERAGTFKLKPLGEEKDLVLFFLDIRNFSPFVETHLPFDVIYIIRKLFTMFNTIIAKHDGHVIETAGDGLYAVFGLDKSLSAAVDSSIAAGFEIFSELKKLNSTYSKIFQTDFEVGIGVHSGKVIVGDITFPSYSMKSVMGFAVNIASRLQDSTKTLNNSFVISDDVMRLSAYKGPHRSSELRLAGISMPVTVHAIGHAYKRQRQ